MDCNIPKFKLKHQQFKNGKTKLVSELVFLLFLGKCVAFFETHSVSRVWSFSLISTHAFCLSPAKFFAWDMCRVVKRIEQDEKYLSLCQHLKFQYFNLCEIFLQRNQSDFFFESRGHFTRFEKFSQNGRPTALSGPREDRPQYILKTRIIERQTFRLRQCFDETLRKWRLIFLLSYFSPTKNSVSDRRGWKSGFWMHWLAVKSNKLHWTEYESQFSRIKHFLSLGLWTNWIALILLGHWTNWIALTLSYIILYYLVWKWWVGSS